MRSHEPFRSCLVSGRAPRAGGRILDLGTGPGEPAMILARQRGPSGHVTGVDLWERMVPIALRVARARGLRNVEFRTTDCTELGFPDRTFDAAVSSSGLQIFINPEEAAREAHRVLRRAGRIAVSVWGTGDKVLFLHAIIGPLLEHAEPDETGYIPAPYETGGPGEMVVFLESAGFWDAREERIQYAMKFDGEEDQLRAILNATPIGHSLSEEPEAVQ